MSQFMRRAQESIKHLTLECEHRAPMEEVKVVFSKCLQLETLTLNAKVTVDQSDALGLLHWPALPLLKTLRLSVTPTEANQMAMVSMVKSRWEAEEGRKIETLFMDRYELGRIHPFGKKRFNEDVQSALKNMQKEGFKVFFTE